MKFWVKLFRRETASTDFIPVIDGLRFLAIITVVLHHAYGYISTKSEKGNLAIEPGVLKNIFEHGNQGVELFFVISGFILAYPFIRYRSGLSEKKTGLRQYFIRRITRLEPPYVISTLLIFLALLVVVPTKYSVSQLITSLAASLFYLNNLIFPGEPPRINNVTWSLEIEVQYYILAPFFIWALWRLKNNSMRRMLQLAIIILTSILSWAIESYWKIPIMSLASFLQYFFAGILLCDMIQLDDAKKYKFLDGLIFFAIGMAILVFIVVAEHATSSILIMKILSPMMMFAFYLIVFYNSWWRKIFSLNVMTLIGGMCYSIYLLHTTVISLIGRLTLNRINIGSPSLYFAVQLAILLLAIMIVSSVFFLLIEKPCMKRDWHIRLYHWLKSMTGKPSEKTT